MKSNTEITKDLENKKLDIVREFAAPVEKVWKAWTESELLDKWWAPKPWKAKTKSMSFTEGGFWLYAMVGPNGETSWCKVVFKTIDPGKSFTSVANFSDEDGNLMADFPNMYWLVEFSTTATGTRIDVTLSFDNLADLEKMVGMGFEGGFTMGLNNLDELLQA